MAPKKRPSSALGRPPKRASLLKEPGCPHSVANFSWALVERLSLGLTVDFERRVLRGRCEVAVRGVRHTPFVILDCLHLAIESVCVEDQAVPWHVQQPQEPQGVAFGQALVIRLTLLPLELKKISIVYETTERSTALQWLTKEQTLGKAYPLCFTQSEAICGRSLMPCQDTPSVKAPFSISLTVPKDFTAVASGQLSGVETDGELRTFSYEQKVPVMSYLIAIVVGQLEQCDIGPRSKCYAEAGVIQAAKKEFEGIVEEFLLTAQEVVGGADYEWGSYNIAVMPSSFPYGGMENPNCTFMSASLIPGDRSLTPTLAHEIVHSWIGNLVTNAFWKDFWLNEGFTRYIERRIMGKMLGPAFRGLLLLVGFNDLVKAVDMLTKQGTPGLTMLEPEMEKIDPDDAFSRVPYEKGSLFLFYLEQIVGGEDLMTEWLRDYVETFWEKSIETSDMKKHFLKFFKGQKRLKEIDWEHWLHGEGLPDFKLSDYVDCSLVDESSSLAESWLKTSTSAAETKHMKAQQWMLFLDRLINEVTDGQSISHDALAAMDTQYSFSSSGNVEVLFRWCLLGCKCKWPEIMELTSKFLASHGRGVYVKPLYLALNAFDRSRAQEVFKENRSFYMAVISRQVAAFLD